MAWGLKDSHIPDSTWRDPFDSLKLATLCSFTVPRLTRTMILSSCDEDDNETAGDPDEDEVSVLVKACKSEL